MSPGLFAVFPGHFTALTCLFAALALVFAVPERLFAVFGRLIEAGDFINAEVSADLLKQVRGGAAHCSVSVRSGREIPGEKGSVFRLHGKYNNGI